MCGALSADRHRLAVVTEPTASDKRLELSYDAAAKKLSMQDATLGNVRTRANTLLATAALFTSFSQDRLDQHRPDQGQRVPPLAAGLLLVLVVALGACVTVVLWPARKWAFVLSAAKIMARYDAGDDEAAIRKYVIVEMIKGGERNRAQLDFKQNVFRAAAVLLVVEVALLVLVVFLQGFWPWLLCFLDWS